MFLPIFVADTKIIFDYNFLALLNTSNWIYFDNKKFKKEMEKLNQTLRKML